MSFNGPLRTPSSSSVLHQKHHQSGLHRLQRLIPKSVRSNDNKLQDDTHLSLRDEITKSHSLERPSTEEAKNRSNANQPIRRRLKDATKMLEGILTKCK